MRQKRPNEYFLVPLSNICARNSQLQKNSNSPSVKYRCAKDGDQRSSIADPSDKSRSKKNQDSATRSLVCYREFPRSLLVSNNHESEQMCFASKSSLHSPYSRSISPREDRKPIFTTIAVNIRKFSREQREAHQRSDQELIRDVYRRTPNEGDEDNQSIVCCSAAPFSIDAKEALSRKFTIRQSRTDCRREELSFDRRPACLFTSIRPKRKIAIDVIRSNEISIWRCQLAATIDTLDSVSLPQGTRGCSIGGVDSCHSALESIVDRNVSDNYQSPFTRSIDQYHANDSMHSSEEENDATERSVPRRVFRSLSLKTETIVQSINDPPPSIITTTDLVLEKKSSADIRGSLSSTKSSPTDDFPLSTDDNEAPLSRPGVSPIMVLTRDPRFTRAVTKEKVIRRSFDPPLQFGLKSTGKPLRNFEPRPRKYHQSPIRVKHLRQRKLKNRNLLKDRSPWMSSCSNLSTSHRPFMPRKEVSVKPTTGPCRMLKYACFSELTYCDIPTSRCIEKCIS